MSNAEPLNLGPIVGHTTHDSVRIWGRGEKRENSRCQGVAQLWTTDNVLIDSQWCRMRSDFDYTGVVDFNNLKPQTQYICRFGVVYTGLEETEMGDPSTIDLQNCSISNFRTMPDQEFDNISFVFGSCRYMRLNETSGRSDKAFRSILRQMNSGIRTDCVLMVGDQIYSDMGGPSRTDAETLDEYLNRYHKSFGTEHIRALMSKCPTYMAIDDHDIANNWSMDRLHEGTSDEITKNQNQFNAAMSAYHSYQLIHSPAFVHSGDSSMSDRPHQLYYQFGIGTSRFFVMDVRTERYMSQKQMISEEQMEALKNWMSKNRDNLKFIVSAVPFFPDIPKFSKEDRWSFKHFVEQRKEILDFISNNNIKRVVFLSGDVHRTMWSTLKSNTITVHSIVSSPFHWWHLPSPPMVVWQKEGPLVGAEDYKVVSSEGFIKDDNFTRVTRENDTLKIEVFHRKGKPLGEATLPI